MTRIAVELVTAKATMVRKHPKPTLIISALLAFVCGIITGVGTTVVLFVSLFTDCFIDRITNTYAMNNKPAPFLIGLALDEQIVETVPLDVHDK